MSKIKMVNGNILCQEVKKKQQGLILPDEKSYNVLTVIQSEKEELIGKNIYVLKTRGTDVEVDNQKYKVVNTLDVILIK